MFKRKKRDVKRTNKTLHRHIERHKQTGENEIDFVHTRIDNTSLDDWSLINLGSANRGYLKFLRPYVNTELQQTPNPFRRTKYSTSQIEMG